MRERQIGVSVSETERDVYVVIYKSFIDLLT